MVRNRIIRKPKKKSNKTKAAVSEASTSTREMDSREDEDSLQESLEMEGSTTGAMPRVSKAVSDGSSSDPVSASP